MNTPIFKLYLYGSFCLLREGSALTHFRGDKARALLAYLALQGGQPIPRQQLTTLLWHGYASASAKASLRVTLSNLRQLFAPWALLRSDQQTVQLEMDAALFWCDAVALAQLLAPDNPQPVAEWAAEAQRLYQGELLANFETIDSQPFRAWLYTHRSAVRQQMEQVRAQVVTPITLPSNLTRMLTPLFGREAEIRTLQQVITNPAYPLVTVVGQGGVGKTRLALAVAQSLADRLTAGDEVDWGAAQHSTGDLGNSQELAHQFDDGIWFVALTDIVPTAQVAEQIAAAIGAALNFSFYRTAALTTQLIDHLREKSLLLILDNFEHLMEGVPFLLTLLQEARKLKLVITSRQQLHVQAEYVFLLQGLPVPDESTDQQLLHQTDTPLRPQTLPSVQLFCERVQRAVTKFRPNQHTYADIAAICRLVDGLPLAIELAAAQVRYRPCHEIRQALTTDYATLTTDLNDVPVRHRSLRLVLADSWRLLSPEEANSLAQCTLFQGSFSAEAAAVITAATPSILTWLVQKSLLHITQDNRYFLHELVRQYASEIFQAAGAEQVAATAQRHSHYYLELVRTQGNVLQGAAPQSAIALLQQELMNIQAAWRWALAHGHLRQAAQCSTTLAHFYQMAGLGIKGKVDFALAVEATQAALAQPALAADQDLTWAWAKFLCAHAQMLLFLGYDQEVINAAQQIIALAPPERFPDLAAIAYCYWGIVLIRQGAPTPAQVQLETALAIAGAAPLTRIEIQFELGNLALSTTRYDEAAVWYQEALAGSRTHHYCAVEVKILQKLAALHHALADYDQIHFYSAAALQLAQQIGARHLEDNILSNLGIVWALRGDYATAQQYFKRALTAQRQSGNRVQQAHVLANLGAVACRIGDYAAAFAYTQKSYQMMQQLGDVEEQPSTLTNLALFAHRLGNHQSAQKYAQQALRHSQQTHKRDKEAGAWTLIGHTAAGLGQWSEAATAYTRAVDLVRALALPYLALEPLAGLVRVTQIQGGSRAVVMGHIEEILAFHAQHTLMLLEEPFGVYLTCYQALAAYNDPRAAALLREAYQQLQSRAALISDEAMRHSFLTRVVANGTVMTLTQQKLLATKAEIIVNIGNV